ncbi:MAG: DUF948 domain-containing protein [Propionibacterium sp.]|nr:MAG: DUF948 domain-containing protein [Propionibacterium sp.]
MITYGEIAAFLAVLLFAIFVGATTIPLLKLGRVLEEVRLWVRDANHNSIPILQQLQTTVAQTNSEIEKISVVTDDVSKVSSNATVVSENAANLSQLFSATLGGPLVKTAAFTYGVRKAFRGEGKGKKRK